MSNTYRLQNNNNCIGQKHTEKSLNGNSWSLVVDYSKQKKNLFVCRLLPSKCCCRCCCCSNYHSITQNKLRISTIRFRFRFTFEIDTRFYFYPTASFSRSFTVRCQLNDRPTNRMNGMNQNGGGYFCFHLFKNDLIILRVFWFGEKKKKLKKLHFSIEGSTLSPLHPFSSTLMVDSLNSFVFAEVFFLSLQREKCRFSRDSQNTHTHIRTRTSTEKKKFELEWHSVVDLTLCDRTKRMNNKRTVLLLLLSFALLIRLLSFSLVVCSKQKELQKITRLKEENISNMFFFCFSFHFIRWHLKIQHHTDERRRAEEK